MIFQEYKENNLALIIIEDNGINKEKFFKNKNFWKKYK